MPTFPRFVTPDKKFFAGVSNNYLRSVDTLAWRKNYSVIEVLDSTVDSHFDAKTSGSQTAKLTSNWGELEKKATKASDSDLNQLTKTLAENWTNTATLSNLVTLPLQATSAIAKLAQGSSETAKSSSENKTAEKSQEGTTDAAKLNATGTHAVKTDNASTKATDASGYIPDALISATEFIFGAISGSDTASSTGVKPTEAAAAKPETSKPSAPHTTPGEMANENRQPKVSRPDSDPFLKTVPPEFQPQLRVENGKLVYSDPLKAVRIEGTGDRRLTAIIGDSNKGDQTQLFANPDGSRTMMKDGQAIYRLNGAGLGFQAGEFSSDGRTLIQKRGEQTLLIAGKTDSVQYYETMTLLHETTTDTVADALAKLKARGIELPEDKPAFIALKNGAALVHPDLNKIIEFKYSKDGVEVHMDLGNGQELLRSPQGKMYILDSKDNSVKELSDEQKLRLMKTLGPKAQIVKHLLQALENGETLKFSDGQEVRIVDGTNKVIATAPNKPNENGEPQTNTVAILTDKGYTVDDPSRKVSFDQKTGELVTETDGKKTSIDLDSANFDMKTDDFVRKDGVVTFDNGAKIADSGNVELPDGTKINAKNDVYFADGSVLYRDGTFVSKDGSITQTIANVPQKANLDSIVSQALSMATAIAGRVHSGSFNPADLALIEANMSVIQNFINLFSLVGNLPMANSLQRSWSILKASHSDAQHESDSQQAAHDRREQEVRAFLNNLEKLTNGSDKQIPLRTV